MKRKILSAFASAILCLGITSAASAAGGAAYHIDKVQNNLGDKASLQRGAQLYMNYCHSCHSLQYTRYHQVGAYIGAVDREGNVYDKLIQSNLNFVSDKVTDQVVNAIDPNDAAKWFGVAPPDLTLVARSRGKDWVYSYLKAFYVDETRPWGVNNAVFPDVGMPHVLLPLQGKQVAVYKTSMAGSGDQQVETKVIDRLEITQPGEMDEAQYDQAITDLVNFLEYVGEPAKEKRTRIGVFVILFLIILTAFLYALKREYWKEVH